MKYGYTFCFLSNFVPCILLNYYTSYHNFWQALLILQSGWLPSSISGRWECPLVSFLTGLISSILWQLTAHNDNDYYMNLIGELPLDQCVANYSIGKLTHTSTRTGIGIFILTFIDMFV